MFKNEAQAAKVGDVVSCKVGNIEFRRCKITEINESGDSWAPYFRLVDIETEEDYGLQSYTQVSSPRG